MNKSKTGVILGALSLLPVLVSITSYNILRGPNSGPTPSIPIYIISSFIGIILGCTSLWLTKPNKIKLLIGIIGIMANVFILLSALLLLFAYGMGED